MFYLSKSKAIFAITCSIVILYLFHWVPNGYGESGHIYKYKGKDGVWRFTDTNKDSGNKLETREAITSAPQPKVRLVSERTKKGDVVYAHNDYFGPCEIDIRFVKIENVQIINTAMSHGSVKPASRRFVMAKRGKRSLFTVQPIAKGRSWQYRFNYRYVPGAPRTLKDNQYQYLPPIVPGRRYQISQGFNGSFSHTNLHNRYAVDIAMPVNTPVYCARAGTVMEVMNNYFWAGKNLDYYGPRSNLIRILHDDGSMGLYVHLQRGSARVKGGQRVREGEMIARSGNTGFSTGPHLHFSVLMNQGMKVISIPFRFKGDKNQGIIPTKGQTLMIRP